MDFRGGIITQAGVAAATYIRIAVSGARTEDCLFNTSTAESKSIPVLPTDQVY